MTPKIALFDAPSKKQTCNSMNAWRGLLALNFKNIDYETRWVEYSDIKPVLKSLFVPSHPYLPNNTNRLRLSSGVPPNNLTDGDFYHYTIPTISFNGEYVMGTRKVAAAIEAVQPLPSLHLDSPLIDRVDEAVDECMKHLGAVILAAVRYGIMLKELEEKFGGESGLQMVKEPLKRLAGFVEGRRGLFGLGNFPSYADIIVVAFLHCWTLIDSYERIVADHPALARLYEASVEWVKRDDH
ncbi:hypothetical protein M501DRAFT_1018014 [Patellaria atrata CBS 101060]|uniref:GST N-terminal domain-containing protein n=1 Tax=Patellaria atrata CBS 101060 TaxID=1346257 RepID=A0A9P4S9B7_9PEZI|nr:hypothetical protein M501DRAFT_1018014 [Patellaria atrata CBS 101060]